MVEGLDIQIAWQGHHLDEEPTPVEIYCSKGPESSGIKIARGVRNVMGPVQVCGVVDG